MPWPLPANRSAPRPRERFARPLAVLALCCAFVLVLALLYPKQGLLGVLGDGDDAATIRYREALLRVHPGDSGLRIKVAGSLLRSGDPRRALAVLDQAPAGVFTAGQRQTVTELRYGALQGLLRQAAPGGESWLRLKQRVLAATQDLAGTNPPAWRLDQLATDARIAGDIDSYNTYRKRYEALEARAKTAAPPADPMAQAMARRDYRAAAAICFADMGRASNIAERRKRFMQGVRTLQAGNLPLEALEAGERHIDGLAADKPTLMFLTRVGLAANQPARAQVFIRRALGIGAGSSKGGES